MDIFTLQRAAKAIETDGIEGLYSAEKLVGMPTALALLITHLRRNYGSMQSWPADPQIDQQIENMLFAEVPAVRNFLGKQSGYFYSEEWYCFDNFSAFSVTLDSRVSSTAEHAYHAEKYTDSTIREIIRTAPSAHQAKKLGNDPQFADARRPEWDSIKRDVMKLIALAKHAQHEYVQSKLMKSRGIILVEDSPRDGYWGRGADWSGENWLGKIWMEVRDQFYR